MNAPNTKWSIVSNVLKPVTGALKHAAKWQKINNDQPLPMSEVVEGKKVVLDNWELSYHPVLNQRGCKAG